MVIECVIKKIIQNWFIGGFAHHNPLMFMKDLEGLLCLGSLHACKVYIVHDRNRNVNLLLIVISFSHSIRKSLSGVGMVGDTSNFNQ